MSCDSTDPELVARDSRFLWDTPLERAATALVCVALPAVLLAWTQYSSWHCRCRWAVEASRVGAVLAALLYTVARAMYIAAPWETSLGSAAAASNLVFSLAAGAFAFYDALMALLFTLCPSRMAQLAGDGVELKPLVDAAAKGTPLYALPSTVSGVSYLCNVVFKSLFLVSMALDISVRCGTVVAVLGWLAWCGCLALWVRSFMAHQSFAARRPRHGDAAAAVPKRRVTCVSVTTNAVLAAAITALFVPVLVLRPYAGY